MLLKDKKAEIGHRSLWKEWAKDSGVELDERFSQAIEALHSYLLVDLEKHTIVKAVGDLNIGIEGTVGVLIQGTYEGIMKISNNGLRRNLTKIGRGWLDVHREHDFAEHPINGLTFIKLCLHDLPDKNAQYQRALSSIIGTSELFVKVLDNIGRSSYNQSDQRHFDKAA